MKHEKINTTNPDAIFLETEELRLTILGGVRIEGLDRMRVTLKIEVVNRKLTHYLNSPELSALALRHNVDLYNDTQVDKLCRRAATRLEIGVTSLTQIIAELTSELEIYRLQKLKEQGTKKETRKALTEEEHSQAMEFLQQENLLQRTNEIIGQSGVVGEEVNRLLMYLIFTSRKREHPLHVITLGNSGTGKTYLQEKVGELIPEEDKIEITVLSENAFYYFGQRELKHKLILIEDLDGAENVLYPLRELQSKRKISKTVAHKDTRGNTKTVHLTVEGPVSVAGCTTRENLYEDNANRSFLIYPDESLNQDEKIMEYQRNVSAGKIDKQKEQQARELLKNSQRLLVPISVRNPFADKLKLPEDVFKPRRTNSHYLQFIEAVTFYHQHQREQKTDETTGEIFVETTPEDIASANDLIIETLLRKSDELTMNSRKFLESVKTYLTGENKSAFTSREIRNHLKLNPSNQKRYMTELVQRGFIKKNSGSKAKGYTYEVVNTNEYQLLRERIKDTLRTSEWSGGPRVDHLENGPLKSLRLKEKTPVVQKFRGKSKQVN